MRIILFTVILLITPVFVYADSNWGSLMIWNEDSWAMAIPTLNALGMVILTILLFSYSIYVLKRRNNEKVLSFISRNSTLKYLLIVCLLSGSAIAVYAGSVTIPNYFTAGTTAIAEEVNANFSAAKIAVDDNNSKITANDFKITANDSKSTANDPGITANDSKITANDPGITANDSKITALDSKITALESKIAALESWESCPGTSVNDIMVKVGPLCVDKYEASVWSDPDGDVTQYGTGSDDYPPNFPDTGNWTTALYAVSKAGVTPARYITWFQAQQACALSGKRLLTNAEWQVAAFGTPDPGTSGNDAANYCNTNTSAVANTGSSDGGIQPCISNGSVYDMVGNLTEWVADWIQGDIDPWAPSTGDAGGTYGSDDMYGINPASFQGGAGVVGGQNFPAVLRRGGGWLNITNAGVFALSAELAPSSFYDFVGFRCAR